MHACLLSEVSIEPFQRSCILFDLIRMVDEHANSPLHELILQYSSFVE
jgi:hypothetical protein